MTLRTLEEPVGLLLSVACGMEKAPFKYTAYRFIKAFLIRRGHL